VFPIVNGNGHVAEIYGRKISRGLRKGTPDHLYLPGAHHGIFNPEALGAPEIILCESTPFSPPPVRPPALSTAFTPKANS